MSRTERLYYSDSHLKEFEARVTHVAEQDGGRFAVRLDRTAFYPTGGGQPSDTGLLDKARVVDCIDEDEFVLHVIEGPSPEVGAKVHGRVDWARRFDHLQQHTGEHILSRAFIKLFNAETRGFRMLEKFSEMDVALNNPSTERIERAVKLANNIIWEDRKISMRQVSKAEAAQLPLTKDSVREGILRIIEIEDFDLSACGGTHAQRTGEVGIICVSSWERAKGLVRIEFAAGGRALLDYNRANKTAREVAAMFSIGRDEGGVAVARLLEENKGLLRRVRELEEIAAKVEALELLTEAQALAGGVFLVKCIFEGRDAGALERLAQAIIARPRAIALIGSRDGETARLVFARSINAPGDMNALMRAACQMIEGRGGGKPDMARGGGRNALKLGEALEIAAQTLDSSDN